MHAREQTLIADVLRRRERPLDLGPRFGGTAEPLKTTCLRDHDARFEPTVVRGVRRFDGRIVVEERFVESAAPIASEPDAALDDRDACRIVARASRVERALPERQRSGVVAEALADAREIHHEIMALVREVLLG